MLENMTKHDLHGIFSFDLIWNWNTGNIYDFTLNYDSKITSAYLVSLIRSSIIFDF